MSPLCQRCAARQGEELPISRSGVKDGPRVIVAKVFAAAVCGGLHSWDFPVRLCGPCERTIAKHVENIVGTVHQRDAREAARK